MTLYDEKQSDKMKRKGRRMIVALYNKGQGNEVKRQGRRMVMTFKTRDEATS